MSLVGHILNQLLWNKMVIKEYLTTRKDGVKLYQTYSDKGLMIKKKSTNEIYDLAIDIENSLFEYEETDKEIQLEEAIG